MGDWCWVLCGYLVVGRVGSWMVCMCGDWYDGGFVLFFLVLYVIEYVIYFYFWRIDMM